MEDFGLTMPLKVHIIVDQLSDYFELKNLTLGHTNAMQKFFENHPNYIHKNKSSDKYGEAILAGIVQFNSDNLGSV